ncbi:MAG: protein kinase [Polyangiaceae bacterium]
MSERRASDLPFLAGRYVLGEVIGRGGAATVHFGKSSQKRREVVAIKRLHPHLAADPAFLGMLLDEARLMSRVHHPNVVATYDVVMAGGELYIVMEYVHGATLGALLAKAHAKKARAKIEVACAIATGALLGLHAAHEATGPAGEVLDIVHRDVSPQNLLVSEHGVLKVVDFGIAKAEGRVQQTQDGSIKGKLGYMSPEQLFGDPLDRRTDVYAMGVVLWETLVGERLFAGHGDAPALVRSLVAHVDPPSARVSGVPHALDDVVLKALSQDRAHRFQSAQAMADAIAAAVTPAPAAEVGAWVRALVGDDLDDRGAKLFSFDQAAREVIAENRETLATLGGSRPSIATTRRRTWSLAVLAAVCAALGGGAAVLFGAPGSDSAEGNAKGPDDAATALIPSGSETKTEAAPPAAPAESATSTGAGDPAASATVAPTSAPASTPSPSVTTGPKTSSAGPRAGASTTSAPQKPAIAANGCDPPFTIDAQGHKRYKRECLR